MWCLAQANILLTSGNLEAAIQLLKAALKIDCSPGAIAQLSLWLQEKLVTVTPLVKHLAQLEIDSGETEQNILTNLSRTIFYNKKEDFLN
ncbi:MAG: hypothetical protein HC775_19375 [Hyellaceae cyanobacterium CSU_1_1]|nr:hypothetical protein [Hyellaceae cyanobacterium CSU_1_1]